ncbi:MAG: TonB-dependent receptor [Ignavibacteriae bacterium]|nr:TonB-dependent receptor [Ignavibacteriota bacterium]NOG97624.1 TonB-dependent receptor [Ignavibacteriota bacterium]
MIKNSTILLLFLLISTIQINAGVTGKLKGTIKDAETGEVLIGANVMLEGTTMGAASDENGEYFILNIPPGKYNIIVSYISYQKQKITGVEILTDRTTEQNILLSSETITTEEVVISGKREAIETDRTNTAAYISSEQISNLPVQDVTDIIQLQSGVVKGANGALHIRGGRSGEINYMIDGVSVTDQYRGGSSIGLENNWVQELQVISGTFNAEYGQAQSGVINIVTKEGSKKFSGSASVAVGDYVSSRNDVFMNIDKINLNEIDASLNLNGPVPFIPNTSYYTSFRYNDKEGWLYGQRRTRIEDTVPIQAYISEAERNQTDREKLAGIKVPDSLQTGDNAYVPLNFNEKYSLYGKFSNKLTTDISVRYSIFYNYRNYKSYSDYRRYAPDGVKPITNKNYNHIVNLNHVLSASTFYTLNFSLYSQNIESKLFDDMLDPQYQGTPHANQGFAFGGTTNSRSDITNSAMTVKIDLTSQVNNANQIKVGASFKKHKLDYFTMSTISDGPVYQDPNLRIPAANTDNYNEYINEPYEAVFYAQDKIELDELIVNVGARLDYWNPNAKIPSNPRAITDPNDGIRLSTEFENADDRFNISPRFGLAYPLSANGVVHVSYGHFFQLPRFNAIFSNSEFEVSLGGLNTIMGNADLKPEQTVNYELGLQQVISDLISVDFTMYYKDIKNLLSQEIINTSDKKVYARYINRDYGNVKGFTVAVKTLNQASFFAALDYTYQVGKGNASDPNSVFTNFQSNPPKESEKQVIPLDWDQAHTLNASLYVGNNVEWSLGLIGRYSTGQPYTPSNPSSELTEQFENSERKPDLFNIDLNFYKNFNLSGFKIQLFCKVFNLLDGLNARYVYSSTGNPEAPYRSSVSNEIVKLNPNFTKAEIDNRPDFYQEPRRVLLGVKLDF